MKIRQQQGIRIIGTVALLALFSVGCAKSPSKPGGGGAAVGSTGADGKPVLPEDKDSPEAFRIASLAAFTTHLYEPLLENECTGCHHPHTTAEESHNYVLQESVTGEGTDRIDLHAPENSPILQRIAANHECSNTDICTGEFVAEAINAWRADIEAQGVVVPDKVFPNTTEAVGFSSGAVTALPFSPNEYIVMPVAAATGTNSYTATMDTDPDGSAKMHLESPAGQTFQQGNAATPSATFNVEVPVAGDYFTWIRVKAADADQNNFFLTVGNNQGIDFEVDPSGEDWVWRQLLDADGNPVVTTLPAGATTVVLEAADGGGKFNTLLLTNRDDPNREIFVTEYFDIEVDISAVSKVPNSKLIATVWKKAQGEEDKKAIGVAEMRIESDVPLRIKNIKPIINGVFSLNHATYTFVDMASVGGPDRASQVIQTGGSTATTWLADYETDQIAFSFEEIGPAQ